MIRRLEGYQHKEVLREDSITVLYRGIKQLERTPVLIKYIKTEYPTLEDIARLKYEYKILQSLDIAGVVKCYALEDSHQFWAMVLEDFGGKPLPKYLSQRMLNLSDFLHIGIQLAETLVKLHQYKVTHKNLKTTNVLFNPQNGQVKIDDFSLATYLDGEKQTISNQNIFEDTLAYISPEQTGRMNRLVDYRSDFYSLGIVFYEILTGQLPFQSTDPLELVHCHIARTPISPCIIAENLGLGEISQPVSDVVMKLLAKTAEERYQNALGLKADLEMCLKLLQGTGEIAAFQVGQLDLYSQFLIPQKLYGREFEVKILMAAFERISQGTTEIMLVSGYSGVGKSSLIYELHKPIVRHYGYFIFGKFDQFKRNIPYAALIQAFQELMRQLLTESSERISIWRAKLLKALGANGQVIIDVIPEVERIIEPQPAVPELGASESQNRFNRVFRQFIYVFCKLEHPLVLFLDDLQWADSASLQLIQLLISDPNSKYLLLIGAYRDNEVSATHSLMLTLSELQQTGAMINNIVLQPLHLVDVSQLVADTFQSNQETSLLMRHSESTQYGSVKGEREREREKGKGFEYILSLLPLTLYPDNKESEKCLSEPYCEYTHSLAELVFNKTQGNPFFLSQLLKSLYQDKLLFFNFNQACWQWDIEKLLDIDITDNVVELMVSRIQKLLPATQNVLKLGACVGDKFTLEVLSIVNEKSLSETALDLWEALQVGLILPLNQYYKIPLVIELEKFSKKSDGENTSLLTVSSPPAIAYKFLHDRVQQAAYSLIAKTERSQTHLRIGELLLEHTLEEELEQNIFEIVNQLNIGTHLLSLQKHKDELAALNLMAGQKAKRATAYDPALKYLKVGLGLLSETSWQTNYDLTLTLYVEATSAEFLNNNFVQTAILVDIVLSNARNIIDKVKVYEIQIQYSVSQNKLKEAIAIILQVLEMLGITLSQELPHALTKQYEDSLTIESLSSLPPMTNDYKLAAMRILVAAGPPTYFADAQLFTSITFTMVNLCIQDGNSAMAAYGYACYSLILAEQLEEIDAGYQSCLLALRLIDQYNAKDLKAEICEIFNGHVRHFKDPLTAVLEPMLEGIQSGLEVGKVQYASYIAAFYSSALFYTGENLESVAQKLEHRLELLNSLSNQVCIDYAKIWQQMVANLLGNSTHKFELVSDRFNETEILKTLIAADNQTALSALYLAKTNLLYLYKEYAQAIENARIAERYIGSVMGTINVSEHSFYYMLALLGQYPHTTVEEQHQYLQIVQLRQQQMEKLANAAPMNFLHKYELVEAEKAKVLGQHYRAMEYYDRAIQNAREHGYSQEEALAAELAAEFYFVCKKERLARDYLTDAYYGYLRWGAIAKVQDLKERYPQVFPGDRALTNIGITANDTIGLDFATLDLATVIKASQALSDEIIQSKLLDKLMNSMIENAGARTGMLLLQQSDQWLLVAEGFIDRDNAILLPAKPIETSPILPVALINYVARTQSTLVLDDVAEEKLFIDDPYIRNNRPKSVLCLPIIYQSKLKGILYLENNLAKGAFTQNHVKVLSLLASQVAISLENAELYQELQTYSQKLESKNAELNQINLSLAAEISDRQRKEVERQQAQEALFQEKELAQVTLQSIGDAVITTDSLGLVRYLNPVAQKLTGWSQLEAQGLPLSEVFQIVNETTREPVINPLETALYEGKTVGLANHTILIARNGDEFPIDDSAAPIRASNGEIIGAVMVFHDVSRNRNLSRQLSWQASHDALTGLVNRREFEHYLEQTINDAKMHNQQYALCYLDLDQFKIVNDTCGHLAGDELLRQVTALFQSQVRKTDTLARIGGDEFGLLLNQCSLEQAQRVCNSIEPI